MKKFLVTSPHEEIGMMGRFSRDMLRFALLVGLTALALVLIDPVNAVVFQAVLIAGFQVGVAHFVRRVMFPHLDLWSVAKKAIDANNAAAAVVFASVVAFLIATMYLTAQVLK